MAERKNIASVFCPEENSLRKVFGELEAAMMTYLWQRGQAPMSEVYKELTMQQDLAYTTVKTVMERVSEKGYLSCNTRQRAYVYTPTQSREAFMRQVSATILNGLFQDFGAIIEARLLEETVRQCDLDALDHLHHGALYGTLATNRFCLNDAQQIPQA